LNAAMEQRVAAEGAHVDRFYSEPTFLADTASAHAIGAGTGKPVSNPVSDATHEWPIVRERSFFVGAGGDDLEAARTAGISAHAIPPGGLACLVHSLLTQSSSC
jgi:histidinol phosphatase-like enzyme